VELENARDFAGALARYRELERQPAIDGELRATFRDRVARNATIVRLLDAMRAATAAGDFAEAQQQLRALRLSFPDVPFDTLAQLPLRVTSEPVGARVLCQGKDAGVTPLLLARTPADATRITVVLPGFRSAEVTVTGDDTGEFCGRLLLVPDHSWRHGRALEVAPVTTGDRLLLVDRAGNVCQANADGDVDWTFRSNDLSGLLSAPIVLPQRVLVASLDGELRCLDRATGKPKWTQPGLPTEAAPAFVADHVVLATTGRDLVAMTADGQERARRTLPAAGLGLVAHGSLVLVLDAEGNVAAFEAPLLQARWRQTTGSRDGPNLLLARGTLLVVDEHGHVVAFDASTGNRRWQQNLEVDVLQPAIVAGNDVLLPTRRSLLRFDVVTGAAGPVVPIASTEFHGGAQVVGNRLLLPLRDGVVLVLDDRGAPLYRLQVGKKPKVLVHGGRTFVTDEDHVVHVFDQLR
jgi:outer membrane protein assembly factor BamB